LRKVVHDDPAVMRPIAEAAVRSGVTGVASQGSVILRRIRAAEASRSADGSVYGVGISEASTRLSIVCEHVVFE
jgi:hypothetical protein